MAEYKRSSASQSMATTVSTAAIILSRRSHPCHFTMLPPIKTFLLLAAAAATTLAQPHSLSCSSTAGAQPTPSVDANAQLLRDLQSAPTAIKRFQRLLVQGGSLLTGDALRKLIVFDFKGAQPASGALGGSAKAAVSLPPGDVSRDATLTSLSGI